MLFLAQLGGELRKLFARRRTWIGYAVFLAMELLLVLVFRLEHSKQGMRELIERNGYLFEQYYTSLTITYWVINFSMFLLGSIYFALVSGDIVAKEAEDGNLRLVLARPVSRLRILLLKYLAVSIYTVSFVFFVGVTGYLMAVSVLGWGGGLFVFSPKMKVFAMFPTWAEGAARLSLAAVLVGLSMISLTSVGFMFSCFRMKPSAATIMALSILFTDLVLQEFPFFRPYQEWFVTWRMSAWIYSLETILPVPKLVASYAWLCGFNVTLFVIGWLSFQLRDFKT
jgi:ABC-2 type transport system permease protein